ncbi:MAG: hypothetical protein IKD89_03435 [Clostridia bacterium]|nr:hypothetical protein [Clostridia bacterium]
MDRSIFKLISRLIFPPKCIVCGELLYEHERGPLCGGCLGKVSFVSGGSEGTAAGIDCVSAVYYMPPIKGALINVKSNEDLYKIKGLCALAARAARAQYKNERFDLIAAVPSSKKSVRRAGFDRMDAYGRALSRMLDIKYDKNALLKTRETEKQHTLSADARLTAQKGAYSASPVCFCMEKGTGKPVPFSVWNAFVNLRCCSGWRRCREMNLILLLCSPTAPECQRNIRR